MPCCSGRGPGAAGHYTLSQLGYFWCQGCADDTKAAAWYVQRFLSMHEGLKAALAFDHDSDPETPARTLEFADILLAMAGHASAGGYRRGSYEADPPSAYYSTFAEQELRGHRGDSSGSAPTLPGPISMWSVRWVRPGSHVPTARTA